MDRRSSVRRKMASISMPELPKLGIQHRSMSFLTHSVCEIADNGFSGDLFDWIPDDLLLIVLSKLSSTASCPSDFINASISCKRFRHLCLSKVVISKASVKLVAMKAKNWSDSAHRFLWRCSLAGNLNACYVLGMIRFYCFGDRANGISLMAKAAIGLHAPALYSLAVIQFNGSGGSKRNKDLQAGVAFCARAAYLGHLDALREMGHCLQDGYGVRQSVLQGRRILIHVSHMEIVSAGNLLTKPEESHPVNRFLSEWFSDRFSGLEQEELKMCSNGVCGRPETRAYEFRRCSMCGTVNYCSRACQSVHWKLSHKMNCTARVDQGEFPAVFPIAAAGGTA